MGYRKRVIVMNSVEKRCQRYLTLPVALEREVMKRRRLSYLKHFFSRFVYARGEREATTLQHFIAIRFEAVGPIK